MTEKTAFKDFFLPPMPETLAIVRAELAKSDPDIGRIGDHIAADVSLAAEVLKVVNSPGFGRAQKITSIPGAIMMLGLKNLINITNGVAVRATMEKHCKHSLDRFWHAAADVASAAAALAGELTGLPQEMAYTLGLMHDCGIPVLMCNSEQYAAFITEAQQSHFGSKLTALERQNFNLDHALVGAYAAKKWYLPDEVVLAIRFHHNFPELVSGDRSKVDEAVIGLVGILKMAEHVSNAFRGVTFSGAVRDPEWEVIGDVVLAYFNYSHDDFEDRKGLLLEALAER